MTKYDDILVKLDLYVREFLQVTAKEYVPQLYEALKEEGYGPADARLKIVEDTKKIWHSEKYVVEHLPKEAKNVNMMRPENTNGIKEKIIIDTDGQPIDEIIEVPKAEYMALYEMAHKFDDVPTAENTEPAISGVQEAECEQRLFDDIRARMDAAERAKEKIFIKHENGKVIGVRRGK